MRELAIELMRSQVMSIAYHIHIGPRKTLAHDRGKLEICGSSVKIINPSSSDGDRSTRGICLRSALVWNPKPSTMAASWWASWKPGWNLISCDSFEGSAKRSQHKSKTDLLNVLFQDGKHNQVLNGDFRQLRLVRDGKCRSCSITFVGGM